MIIDLEFWSSFEVDIFLSILHDSLVNALRRKGEVSIKAGAQLYGDFHLRCIPHGLFTNTDIQCLSY